MKQLYICSVLEKLSIAAENQISDCFFYAQRSAMHKGAIRRGAQGNPF